MNQTSPLQDAYNQSKYQLANHGKRNIEVLKNGGISATKIIYF